MLQFSCTLWSVADTVLQILSILLVSAEVYSFSCNVFHRFRVAVVTGSNHADGGTAKRGYREARGPWPPRGPWTPGLPRCPYFKLAVAEVCRIQVAKRNFENAYF